MNLTVILLAAGLLVCGAAHAQEADTLLQRYGCRLCHADRETKAGPAYVDVAVKYRNNPNAVPVLVAVIRKGVHGEGPWPMPPLPEVPQADAKKIAEYILSMKE